MSPKNGDPTMEPLPRPGHPFDVQGLATITAAAARSAGYTQLSMARVIVETLHHSRGETPVSAYNYLLALYEAMGDDEPEQLEAELIAHASAKTFDLINELRRKSGDDEIPPNLRERLIKWCVKDVTEERRA